jgi:hypothetical protein
MGCVSKGWKLGFGIPLLLLGLVLVGSGGLMLSFIGADGRLTSPAFHAASEGVAIVADDIQIENLPGARDTFTGLQATVELDITSTGGDLFIGVAPAEDAMSYLRDAPIDVVSDFDPFDVRTRPIRGRGQVEPPSSQDFWVASTEGGRPFSWELLPGEWWLVVMNPDGSAGVDVGGTASIDVPVLGAAVAGLLVFGLATLAGGLIFVISATRTAPRARPGTPPPPPPSGLGGRPAPPRPDAIGWRDPR